MLVYFHIHLLKEKAIEQHFNPLVCPVLLTLPLYNLLKQISLESFNFYVNTTINTHSSSPRSQTSRAESGVYRNSAKLWLHCQFVVHISFLLHFIFGEKKSFKDVEKTSSNFPILFLNQNLEFLIQETVMKESLG